MRAFRTGLQAQWITLAHSPNSLLTLATMPFSAVVFLAVVRHAGRSDLVGHAMVAPVLMAQWALALLVAGELVEAERRQGTLELIVLSATSFARVLAGRVAAVTILSTVGYAEVWAVATVGFDLEVGIGHPGAFFLAALVTVTAVAGWATVLAAALVLTRATHVLQNSLTFPVYLLGGVLVPVSFLPWPLRLVSRAVFLSWGADLLRDAYQTGTLRAFVPRVLVLVGFAVVGFLLGNGLLRRSLRVLRVSGRLGVA